MKIFSYLFASKIVPLNGVGKSVALVDWDCAGHSVSGVQDQAGGPSSGVEGEDSLACDVEGRDVEGLEHDLCHFLAIDLGVFGGCVRQEVLSVSRQGCSSGVILS